MRSRVLLAALVVGLAACQPRARRLLLLDLTLADPALLAGTAAPWIRAGYDVEYRRFYPHITRADARQYRVVMVLGGLAPAAASDALRPSDLSALADWVGGGGVLVFGYAAGKEGALDRWIMTRWLAARGVGIAIGEQPLRDAPVQAPIDGAVRDAPFAPFPSGRSHALQVSDRSAILAVSRGQPVMAAARLRDGLIIVASRHALATLGPELRAATGPLLAGAEQQRTRAYLAALARWTRRPAEWAHVPPVRRPRTLDLSDAPRALSSVVTRAEPPGGVAVTPVGAASESTSLGPLPAWARRQGVRVLHDDRLLRRITPGGIRQRSLDSLFEFLETGGMTALWTRAAMTAVAESALWQPFERDAMRKTWQQIVERLQTTSVRWLPGIDLDDVRAARDSVELDARGDTVAPWAALDARLWDDLLRHAVRALARLAGEQPEVVPAIVFDLATYGMASGFSDPTFRAGLAAVPGDSAWKAALLGVPAAARYDSLVESGRLAAFYAGLERAVAQRAAGLRTEARRFSRQLGFAVHAADPPADWFSVGLLRGLADSLALPLVFTNDARTGVPLARLRAPTTVGIPVIRLDPAAVNPRAWTRLGGVVFQDNAGFWLDVGGGEWPASPDSLARLVRQLTREARLPEETGRR
jgi:hypothetical protein